MPPAQETLKNLPPGRRGAFSLTRGKYMRPISQSKKEIHSPRISAVGASGYRGAVRPARQPKASTDALCRCYQLRYCHRSRQQPTGRQPHASHSSPMQAIATPCLPGAVSPLEDTTSAGRGNKKKRKAGSLRFSLLSYYTVYSISQWNSMEKSGIQWKKVEFSGI